MFNTRICIWICFENLKTDVVKTLPDFTPRLSVAVECSIYTVFAYQKPSANCVWRLARVRVNQTRKQWKLTTVLQLHWEENCWMNPCTMNPRCCSSSRALLIDHARCSGTPATPSRGDPALAGRRVHGHRPRGRRGSQGPSCSALCWCWLWLATHPGTRALCWPGCAACKTMMDWSRSTTS
jgi:hypothetical protein